MRDVNKIGLGLIFAVLVVFGLYEYSIYYYYKNYSKLTGYDSLFY